MDSRPRAESARPLKAVLPYVLAYKARLGLAALFLVLAAAATLTLPAGVRQVIDLGFSTENAGDIDRYFVFLFLIAVAMALFSGLRFYFVSWIGERVVADLREAVYRRVIHMDPLFFEVTRTGEVLSRLNTDTTLVQTVVGSSASIALRTAVMLLGSVVLLVLTSPRLAGMMGLVIPLVVVPIVVLGRWVRSLSRRSQDRVADFSALGSETLNAVATVQSCNQADREAGRFADAVQTAFATAIRRTMAGASMSITVVMLVFGSIVLVLWSGANAVIEGAMSAGELSQFVLYAVIAASSAGALSEVYADVQRAAGAMERIAELLSARPAIASPSDPVDAPLARGALRLDQVVFTYPSRPDSPALSCIDFTVAPGETVAIVGPSGAGKTTLFQLLMRFYDPDSGSITMDGVDLRQLDLNDVRNRIAVVAQEPVIFSTTVLENIRYGRPEAFVDEVRAAAVAAHAEEFIRELPDAFDTHLGEKGVRLSGGQRQRMAIARAILRDPAILLLDEATSALDAESERAVQAALDEISATRTTLVIAHRLATVRSADRILVIDRGRLVAAGSHGELVESSELYSRLASLQFAA